jgi:hypothetical protein
MPVQLTKQVFAWRARLDKAACDYLAKLSYRAEHWGFVMIAAVDAFHLHSFLFVVSLWLLITGLCAEFFSGSEVL